MNMPIPPLQKGDLIYITAPAKSIETEPVFFARDYFEKAGFRVRISPHCFGTHHYFSGSDSERTADFQQAIDDPDVKAILCARGGYGCVRILDRLQWAAMLRQPKWIIGFSDVTVFHQRIQRFDLPSIHASMPLNFKENTPKALNSLVLALTNESYSIQAPIHLFNKRGKTTGKLVGGNLSILFSLLGTDDQIDYTNTILFIEDLAEQLYHIDRIFYALSKAGILSKIKGLIVGGMTGLKDTAVPFGKGYEEIILDHFTFQNIPIAFDFPAGHINDNRALVLGSEIEFEVTENGSLLYFNKNLLAEL
jgi:muramoyltetrapeptide carboxypeptidase